MTKLFDETEIRKMVIAGKADAMRELLLPQKLVDELKNLYCQGEFTAAAMSSAKGITIQNASTRLAKHFRRGYLNRRLESAESGGVEYIYFLPDWAREEL